MGIDDNFLSFRELWLERSEKSGGSKSEAPLLPLLRERLFPLPGPSPADIWIQAVSVGEVEIAVTLVKEIRALRPATSILVTSTTPAGVALLRRRFGGGRAGLALRACPLDLGPAVRRFLDAVTPRLLVLVETELWPVTLGEAARRGMPVLVVNGRLSERSVSRLRLLRPLVSRAIGALTHVAARSQRDAERFEAIGVRRERIAVSGDLKLDREPPAAPPFAPRVRTLARGRPVVVAGSIADEEVGLVLETRRRLAEAGTDAFFVLAPRRPGSFDDVARRLETEHVALARRTAPDTDGAGAEVFLLDTLGELAGAYLTGRAALLGGTWAPRGGHNVLEPLRAGLAVVHGPSTSNIREALERAGEAAIEAKDASGAAAALGRILADEALCRRVAAAASALFATHAGATRRAAQAALDLLPEHV